MKAKKVVVFGATGSVGAYTVIDLINLGYEVIAVGYRESDNGFFAKMGVTYFSLDIIDKDQFSYLPIYGIDCVMHFAGAMPSKMEGYCPKRYIDTIITGTYNILEYTRMAGAKKIIFTQTRADSNHLIGSLIPIPSDLVRSFPKIGDHSIYTICKNTAVDLIEHYHYQFGLNRFILRLPTIYAWHPNKYFYVNGEKMIKAYRLLIDRAIKSEPIEIWGDPLKTKEIVYVKDLVKIIILSLENESDGGFFNVGNGYGVTLEQQIKGIIEIFSPSDNQSAIIYRPDMNDARQFIHDISKTKEILGYQPSYTYLEMLKDFKSEMLKKSFEDLWESN